MEREVINNAFYQDLGSKWYEAYDHPIALLRAENKTRAPWIAKKIAHHFSHRCTVLDVGCGAGFLSNALAQHGHYVTGIDLSEHSLEVARENDVTAKVFYCHGNAYSLPFADAQFECVCAMDLLEHVEEPWRVIQEAARVLKPNGLFFFHTFNRTWLSWLFVLKGVEWFVPNTPQNIHLFRLFIKPKELQQYLKNNFLKLSEMHGLAPSMDNAFFKLILKKQITENFSFKITSSLKSGYMGFAVK